MLGWKVFQECQYSWWAWTQASSLAPSALLLRATFPLMPARGSGQGSREGARARLESAEGYFTLLQYPSTGIKWLSPQRIE